MGDLRNRVKFSKVVDGETVSTEELKYYGDIFIEVESLYDTDLATEVMFWAEYEANPGEKWEDPKFILEICE